ncbi:GNAT family N-acetyltransferase [Silvibacterium sp.]|uniref:GNAT family N-acetyltransferase n=1 Tax=Silvibacterium sp. TaxID=1964179 RepID=UPI0039E71541
MQLQPLRLEDAEQAQPLFARWEIVQYLNSRVPWPFPDNGCFAFYRDSALPAMAEGREWHWTLRLNDAPDTIIGSICLVKGDKTNRGFWLGTAWHGRGLMTEAVAAVNDFWFEVLGEPRLRAPKAIRNAESRRISEKTGMRVVERMEDSYVGGVMFAEVWEQTAEEWRACRGRVLEDIERGINREERAV